ncbi:MAG: YihY/virulence factor BrkB family protein [Myxococcales bacterium]|nr:YihY/virulence factor BrkB family protein [Myxococcales bacterium]
MEAPEAPPGGPRGPAARLRTGIARVLHDFGEHQVVEAASAMAFDAFFSLMPLLALFVWGAHALSRGPEAPLAPLWLLLPPTVADLAENELAQLGEGGVAVLAPVSVVAFLWLASEGVVTAMRAFERLHRAPPRTFWRRRFVAMGLVVLSIVLLGAAGTLSAFLELHGAGATVATAPTALALVAVVVVFFRTATLPDPDVPRRGASRGALTTMVLGLGVSVLFTVYVQKLARFPLFYGSLGAIVALLAWLWVASFALLLGGYVHARIERAAPKKR